MLKDDVLNFVSNIHNYLVNEDYVSGLLIKSHTGNFKTHGDFSFVNTIKSWHEFITCEETNTGNLLSYINKNIEHLIDSSQSWPIPITKCKEVNERIYIFIDRPTAINVGLKNALANNLLLLKLMEHSIHDTLIQIDPRCINSSVTSLRAKCLADVIKNLCLINTFNSNITVSTISTEDVFVGPVLNAKSGTKENTITASELIRIRQNELTLIAQHKYGVRPSTEKKWKDSIAHLGESSVVFELLQTKSSSPVKIFFDSSSGSSKSAAFILYNCARMETLIRTFNEKVDQGYYPSLPNDNEIDFSLLNNEDEWCLIFQYIMGLPSLLRSAVELNGDKCEFRPHLICNYLSGIVKVFSMYYRRVRILTEPRKQLVGVMFARLHVMMRLNETLKTCLTLLNIKFVKQMYLYVLLFCSNEILYNSIAEHNSHNF